MSYMEREMLADIAKTIANYVPNELQRKVARKIIIALEKGGIETEKPFHSDLFRMSGFPCTCEHINE